MQRTCAWCQNPRRTHLPGDPPSTSGICWDCLVTHFPGLVHPSERSWLYPTAGPRRDQRQ